MMLLTTGSKFGKWVVRHKATDGKYLCVCACGTEAEVPGTNLTKGRSTQCKRCQNRSWIMRIEPRCRRCGHPKLGHTISLTCPAGTLDNWRGMGYRETRYEAEDEDEQRRRLESQRQLRIQQDT